MPCGFVSYSSLPFTNSDRLVRLRATKEGVLGPHPTDTKRSTKTEAPYAKGRASVQVPAGVERDGIDLCALGAACVLKNRFFGKARIPPPWPNG